MCLDSKIKYYYNIDVIQTLIKNLDLVSNLFYSTKSSICWFNKIVRMGV
jgi:hypothetical protein